MTIKLVPTSLDLFACLHFLFIQFRIYLEHGRLRYLLYLIQGLYALIESVDDLASGEMKHSDHTVFAIDCKQVTLI